MGQYVAVRPNPVCWSKNFMKMEIYYDNYNSGWQMQVQFLDDSTNDIISEVIYPTAGSSGTIEIRDLNEQLDYYLSPTYPYSTDTTITEQSTFVDVKARFRPFASGSSFNWTYDTQTFRVFKGGIESMLASLSLNVNHGGYTRAKFCPNGKNYLTWIPSGRTLTTDEIGWMLYFNDITNEPECKYRVHYMDGTSNSYTRSIPNITGGSNWQYRMWYLPIGIEQADLDPLNKGVYYYDLQVWEKGTANQIASYHIYVDTRHYYHTQALYYRNSFYGMDHILLRGVNMVGDGAIDRKDHEFQLGYSNEGVQPVYQSKSRIQFKGNTGYLDKDHKMSLMEMATTTYCALFYNSAFLPMRMSTEKLPVVSNADYLHAYEVSYETANEYERMPKELLDICRA